MSGSPPPLQVLFDSLVNLETPEERASFLDFTCRDAPELRGQLERLYQLQYKAADFFDVERGVTLVEDAGTLSEPTPDHPPGDAATEGVGTRISHYRLLERLGEGGCGVVFLAEQTEPVRRRVALKIIRLGMDTESVVARFKQESQALALMDHPNIARVLDVGTSKTGRPFFVMQYVDGEKITAYCDKKQLSVERRLQLFTRVCMAIQHAHQKGVIHRDIKPSNVMVWENDGEPVPKVIDFGIAKATGAGFDAHATFTVAGQLVGTPAYMSPEQAAGSGMDVDTRTDIFSLGCVLYELLAGRPPIEPGSLSGSAVDEVRHLIREVDPPEPSAAVKQMAQDRRKEVAANRSNDPQKLPGVLKGDLDRIVMKALAKERRHRYPTAEAFAADVTRYLHNEPVLARSPSRFYQLGKMVSRNRLLFAGGGAVLLSLMAGLGGATVMYHRAVRARDATEVARANEENLRRRAESGMRVAQAAVHLRYGNLSKADEVIAESPASMPPPTLEGVGTFRALGLWHAREGRWREAAERFSALAGASTRVDAADSDLISLDVLMAAAATCRAGNQAEYENVRNLALRRFGNTGNAVVAEQVVKACLMRPANPEQMVKLGSLELLLDVNRSNGEPEDPLGQYLAAWRDFSSALAEYRRGNYPVAVERVAVCTRTPNDARVALAHILTAMISRKAGGPQDPNEEMRLGREMIERRKAAEPNIFDVTEPLWTDWVFAEMLLKEAEGVVGR